MEEEVVDKKKIKSVQSNENDFDAISIASNESRDFQFSRSKHNSEVEQKSQTTIIKDSQCRNLYPPDDSPTFPLTEFFISLITRRPNYNEETNFISQSKMRINIPHTVIFGIDDNPIMYFTDSRGRVVRVDNVTLPQVERKITFGVEVDSYSVVQKKDRMGAVRSNNSQLLNAKQLKTILETQGKGKVLFQRFVDCKGPKACITRFVWRKHKTSIAYMISNRKTKIDKNEKEKDKLLLTNCESSNSVNVFKVSGKVIPELQKIMKYLVSYLEKYWRAPDDGKRIRKKLKFSTLACDFIKDKNNVWWLLQIKGFKLIQSKYKLKKKCRKSYIKLKSCKMCMNYYKPRELIYRMSLKMIYATECHLKQRAEYLPWFGRPEFNSVTDTSMWYESHKVCKNCFDMYLQEQKLSKVEMEFAKAIGIPVQKKTTQKASILDNLNNMLTIGDKGTSYKRISSVKLNDANEDIPETLCMYRLITFINEIRNVPDDLNESFSLVTKIFDEEEVVKVNVSDFTKNRKSVKIGKLRVYYFFVENEEKFHEWILKKKNISVHFVTSSMKHSNVPIFSQSLPVYKSLLRRKKKTNSSTMGRSNLLNSSNSFNDSTTTTTSSSSSNVSLGIAKLELKQFSGGLIDKLDFMSLFSSKILKLCSVRAVIGFVKMKTMDMSNIKVKRFGKIFIPKQDFFTADPLPSEWMEIIPGLSNELRLDKIAKVDKNILKRSKRSMRKKNKYRTMVANSRRRKKKTINKRPMSARISRKKNMKLKHRTSLGSSYKKRPKSARKSKRKYVRRNSYGMIDMERLDLDVKKTRFLKSYGRKYSPIFGSVFASIQRNSTGRLTHRPRSTGRLFTRSNSSSSLTSTSSSYYTSRETYGKGKSSRYGSNGRRFDRVKSVMLSKKRRKKKKNGSFNRKRRKNASVIAKENNFVKFSKMEEKLKRDYKNTDNFYSFRVDIGPIKDLNSELDETWLLTYKLLYTQTEEAVIEREFESFQLQDHAPLEFDVKDSFYILTDEDDLLNYFSKERILRISLQKKYNNNNNNNNNNNGNNEKRVSFIDLSKLIGKNSIVEYAPFEKVKDNQSDLDLKFFNYNSNIGDDEEIDDDDDVDDANFNKENIKNCVAKVKVFLKKIKKVSECKRMDKLVVLNQLKSYKIKLVKDVPL